MCPIEIKGEHKQLNKIFSDDFLFRIPRYQRPYAWTEEHSGELLDDILVFLGDNEGPIEDLDPYFLGSIVLIKGSDPEAEVIDGQQRITTLTILLSALRETINSEHSSDLTKFLYEEGNEFLGTTNRYRLELRRKDTDFFRKYIQDENGIANLRDLNPADLSDSQKNIRSNALLYLDMLGEFDDDRLHRLAQYIIIRCYLVVVSTPDLDAAYRIFSILNDRGLNLSHTDILKAEIIGNIDEDSQENYTDKWEKIEDDLGRERFQDLFSHIRMIERRLKLRSTLLREFREYVKPSANPVQFIDETLIPYSEAFDIIINTAYQAETDSTKINSKLKWLNKVDNFDWIAPAILFLSKNRNNHDNLAEFFTGLDRLASTLMINRANVNDRIDRYGKLIESIENGDDLSHADSPLQLTEDERTTAISQLSGDLYLIQRIRLYVLMRLDEALSDAGAWYERSIISIEHVLPQTPADDSDWVSNFSEDDRNELTHSIGNLALLSRRKNSAAWNYDFETKKSTYFTNDGISHFPLTTQVLAYDEWTPSIIRERKDNLVDKCKEIWSL